MITIQQIRAAIAKQKAESDTNVYPVASNQAEIDALRSHPNVTNILIIHHHKEDRDSLLGTFVGTRKELTTMFPKACPAYSKDIITVGDGKLYPTSYAWTTYSPDDYVDGETCHFVYPLAKDDMLYCLMHFKQDEAELFDNEAATFDLFTNKYRWLHEVYHSDGVYHYLVDWGVPDQSCLLLNRYGLLEYMYARLLYHGLHARASYHVVENNLVIDFSKFPIGKGSDYFVMERYEKRYGGQAPRMRNERKLIEGVENTVAFDVVWEENVIIVRDFDKNEWRPIFDLVVSLPDNHTNGDIEDIKNLAYD